MRAEAGVPGSARSRLMSGCSGRSPWCPFPIRARTVEGPRLRPREMTATPGPHPEHPAAVGGLLASKPELIAGTHDQVPE